MLKFLRFSQTGEGDPLFQEAVKAVSDVDGVEVVWVGEEVKPDKGLIYVLESFDTPQYEALLNKCRVIGPAVVLAHLKHGWPLPASTQPVFSLAMHGVVACFTQAGNKEKREKLTELVKLMGGKVEGDFTKRVTHLIAGHVGSTKYHVARKLHLPVLLPSWVESCWSDSLKEVVYATHPTTVTPHLAPPFVGLTITVTGLDEKARSKVKQLCMENGGNYSGELTKDVCTHLLVGNKSSTKYKYARQWKMYCVTPHWFHDSVQSGYCMPEADYDVDSEADGGMEKGGDKAANDWKKKLDVFKLPTVADDEFLDGCKIFLSGFAERELVVLYKVINLGGGVRLDQLGEDLSHVVMGNKDQPTLRAVQELRCSPHVVDPQWLLDCCTRGERVPEEEYLCVGSDENNGGRALGKKRKLPGGENGDDDATKRLRYQGYDDNSKQLDEEDLMDQYKMGDSPVEASPTVNGVLTGHALSVSRLFSADDQKNTIQVITRHGGKVVSPPNGSYHLLPLGVSGASVETTGATHTTTIWLQRCIIAGSILDPSSHFLFKPMTTPISRTTLSGCVLAFSQFSDIEREHLVRFSKELGAVVQDDFARYPGHDLLATTHLILKEPSGKKYTFSHKWGIPALADSWLFACAESQTIVPVDQHLVSLLEPAQSPANSALPLSSTAPPTSCSDNVQPTAYAERNSHCGDDQEGDVEDGLEDNGPVLSGVIIALSKKLLSQEAELRPVAVKLGAQLRKRLDQKCTHFFYQGKATEALRDREVRLAKEQDCFIVSPHWLSVCSERCARVEEADYPHTYNPNMSLAGLSMPKSSLTQSQAKITTPNTGSAKHRNETDSEAETESENSESDKEDTRVPSSEAAKKLQEHLKQINEAPMDQVRRRRSRRLLKKGDKSTHTPQPLQPSHQPKSPHKKGRSRRDRRGRRNKDQLLESQVTDSQLLQVTYDDPKGRKEREQLLATVESRKEELPMEGGGPKELPVPSEQHLAYKSKASTSTAKEVEPVMQKPKSSKANKSHINDKDLPPSTPAAPSLNIPIVTHSNKSGKVQQLYNERSSTTSTRTRKQYQLRILLSSLDQREKLDYGALIQQLGGEYVEQDCFTTRCTHLVVGKASRTEKYLGACAAGKWVLHKSFLEESRVAGVFVKEEPHEWGVARAGDVIQPLEAAPKTWRLALAEKQRQNPGHSVGGAFEGWKVLLFAERSKVPGMKRLLEAGGAQVLSSTAHKSATHAFISITCFPKNLLSLEQLVSSGVHCLKPEYIADYLAKGSAIKTESFYINEVKPLLQRNS